MHTESSSGKARGPCTCSGNRDAAPRGCWQDSLPPRLGPQMLSEEQRSCSRAAGGGRGGDGEENGTEGGSSLRVVCSNPKSEGNWVIVPLIHLITGQSSSLAC